MKLRIWDQQSSNYIVIDKSFNKVIELINEFMHYYGELYFDEFPIQLYTGFTTEAGDDIYVGDFVKLPPDMEEYCVFAGDICEVIYEEGFRLRPLWLKTGRSLILKTGKDIVILGQKYKDTIEVMIKENR